MIGQIELNDLGIRLADVRGAVSDQATGATILTAETAVAVDSALKAAKILCCLRAHGIPIYRYDDEIPLALRPKSLSPKMIA